jgi:hypothetical protein
MRVGLPAIVTIMVQLKLCLHLHLLSTQKSESPHGGFYVTQHIHPEIRLHRFYE